MRKGTKARPWTQKEIRKLERMVGMGTYGTWVDIAKHFPGRTTVAVRQAAKRNGCFESMGYKTMFDIWKAKGLPRPYARSLAGTITRIMKASDMTTLEIEKRTGVSRKTLDNWRSGKYLPQLGQLLKWCQAMNVKTSTVLEDSGW